MFDLSSLKNNNNALKDQINNVNNNKIKGVNLGDFIFNKIITKVDPIQYCERVLRAHLPEKKVHLHENQVELIRAVCNPHKMNVA